MMQPKLTITHMESAMYTPSREIAIVEVNDYCAGHFYLTDGKAHRDLIFTWRDALHGVQHVAFPMADAWPTEDQAWRVIVKYRPFCWQAA